MKLGAFCDTASSISCGTLLDGRCLLSSWPGSSETPKYAWTRQINMSYKRCLVGLVSVLKLKLVREEAIVMTGPNPLQDILVIVENIRVNILSISFLIPWDSCPRNQQKGDIRLTRKYEISLVSAMRRVMRSSKEIGSLRNCPTSLGLESIRSNTSLLWIR